MSSRSPLPLGALALALLACAEDDPEATPRDGEAADAGGGAADGDATCGAAGAPSDVDDPACAPLAGDYAPGADDEWPACISDDGVYAPFGESIGSIARVGAFEEIAALLLGGDTPSAGDFTDARLAYSVEQGLESRVSRREDEHYPPAPAGCNELSPEEQQEFPERCAGPARILPILNDAFAAGMAGEDPASSAARIEAALLWFLYLSTYKEARTCATTAPDCDSSWAYYTGGEAIDEALGLGRYVRALTAQAHGRTFDGILAVRCWRDLDNPTGAAEDLALRDRAVAQLDRALLRGVAVIVRDRFERLGRACEGERAPLRAFLQVLGPALDREARARDEEAAATLRAELAREDPGAADTAAATAALDALFPCP